MAITIYDVAREANVSMATVSRVVNGNQNVKPATRKKVLDCIERLGYRPNAVARGLASKRTTTIGVIVPDMSKSYYAELSRGIADVATMYEYNIIISNSDKSTSREVELFEDHLGKQVDGLIFMSDSISPEVRKEMKTANVPIVLAGTLDFETNLPSVNIDHEQAAYDVTKKLIDNGHQRIAFVSGPFTRDINRLCKRVGYIRALEEAGMTIDESLIVETDNTYDDAYESWNVLGKLSNPPTAVMTSSDEVAIGIMNGVRDENLRIPEDVEIICFQHSILARIVRPQLTAIVVPLYDLGAVSMRLLTKLMNKEEVEETEVVLPYYLEERQSVKK
ncbi:catabolite control protein A [Sporosarcina sp. P21c]|uniref:catabolite control protein A n=1 Tax=Sporosarcina TaxID=1569 RepID=UPI000A1525E0|nr:MULTISPECIES: catabolite control protein A [Sporosarcina]ARJ38042.1 catabolite control protein A [Sporosarcina ureae]PIC66739.1 catabolite control protein A [Sporosarcina sp. P16a]PIC82078.1 catabolite control protein A [Sporosarcina sp. P1]PIC89874.1 catabolite control protein A [Sporosarcina sp. P21c]PIC93260.1 catabolite control protein A [Sporosarcina sp. P25]